MRCRYSAVKITPIERIFQLELRRFEGRLFVRMLISSGRRILFISSQESKDPILLCDFDCTTETGSVCSRRYLNLLSTSSSGNSSSSLSCSSVLQQEASFSTAFTKNNNTRIASSLYCCRESCPPCTLIDLHKSRPGNGRVIRTSVWTSVFALLPNENISFQ